MKARCQAVSADDFRFLGDKVLDMTPHGLLVACDTGVRLGEEVLISFQAPRTGEWIDAEGRVVRVIEGFRQWDPGYCVGVQLTHIELPTRMRLHELLRGFPPPVPCRDLR